MRDLGTRALLFAVAILIGASCSAGSTDASLGDRSAKEGKADGPTIRPGKWQARRTVTRTQGSRTDTVTWCVTREQALDLPMAMVGGGECRKTSESKNDGVLAWTIECQTPGRGARAFNKGQLRGGGDRASLDMETTTFIGAESVTSRTVWEGKRIGDCDREPAHGDPR
jgi:hypothetical protein